MSQLLIKELIELQKKTLKMLEQLSLSLVLITKRLEKLENSVMLGGLEDVEKKQKKET